MKEIKKDQLTHFLKETIQNQKLSFLVNPPKSGLTQSLHESIQQVTQQAQNQQQDSTKERPSSSSSSAINATTWNEAYSKYHNVLQQQPHDKRTTSTTTTALLLPENLSILYIDLRGCFQKPLLLQRILQHFTSLPLPEDFDGLVELWKCILLQENIFLHPLHLLILDHLSKQAIDLLFEDLPYHQKDDFSMGIIVVCNLVVDLQPHILENYVRVEDILELDSLALDAVQNVVMTELNSIEDVLVDLFGGQPSSSGSDLLTYLYYPSIKEESAKCSVLTKPGDVSAPGLAWMLSNIPSDLLEKIKEDLEDRPIVGASSLKEVVGYHYFIILFLYLSLMLESEHCKVAVFVKLINIVKAYERIYPLHSSSSSSLSVNGDHVLQIACEGLPVTMAKFLEDQNDLELCLNLGLLARRSNESLMHGGDEGDGEAKDEGTWIIPHCVTSLILCHPSYTSKEVGDVSSNSHCGNPLLQSILSYLQGERDHNDETNRLFFQLACDYERRLLEDDTMLHTSSVELTVDMGLLLLSNPVELCLFNTIYEKLLLAYGVSKILLSRSDWWVKYTSKVDSLRLLQVMNTMLDILSDILNNLYCHSHYLMTRTHFNDLIEMMDSIHRVIQDCLLDRVTQFMQLLLYPKTHDDDSDQLSSSSSNSDEDCRLYGQLTLIKFQACQIFLPMLIQYFGNHQIISLSAKQYDKLGVLIQEMESLISHRLTSPPPSDDVVESITKQCEVLLPCVRSLCLSMMKSLTTYHIIYDNIIAYQSKILLYQLLVNQQHVFYRLHHQMFFLHILQNTISSTTSSTLDLYIFFHHLVIRMKPTLHKYNVLYHQKDIPLSMEGEEGSGNRGGGMMAADEETLFGELIALPSPHLTSSKHRHSFHRSLSTTPSATIPVYMEANLNYLLTMMKLVRSMKKSTIATAAVGSHNNEIEVMMEDLQDGVMMAFLTFLQTTSPSQLPSSSSSYSSSSEEKEEDKVSLQVLKDFGKELNGYISFYMKTLIKEEKFPNAMKAHQIFGLAIYLHLLYLHLDQRQQRRTSSVQHDDNERKVMQAMHKVEKWLTIYERFCVTNHHFLLGLILKILFMNLAIEYRYNVSKDDIVKIVHDISNYRESVLTDLKDRINLYDDMTTTTTTSTTRDGAEKGENPENRPENTTQNNNNNGGNNLKKHLQSQANAIYAIYREMIYLIHCYFYLQDCLILLGQYCDQSRYYEESIQIYLNVAYSYQLQRVNIDSVVLNRAYNQSIQIEDYNVSITLASVLVMLGSSLYRQGVACTGNNHKYTLSYTNPGPWSSVFPMAEKNNIVNSTTLFIPKSLYDTVNQAYITACRLYDYEFEPELSAPFIYRIFKLIIMVHKQQQLYGICKKYYDNILKLCTEVTFLDRDEITMIYKDYGNLLMLNGDYEEALVIYSLAMTDYKNHIQRYWHATAAMAASLSRSKSIGSISRELSLMPPGATATTSTATAGRTPTVNTTTLTPSTMPTLYLDDLPMDSSPAGLASPSFDLTGSPSHPPATATAGNKFDNHPLASVHSDSILRHYYEEMLDCLVCKCQILITTKQLDEAQSYAQFALQRFLFLFLKDPPSTSSHAMEILSSTWGTASFQFDETPPLPETIEEMFPAATAAAAGDDEESSSSAKVKNGEKVLNIDEVLLSHLNEVTLTKANINNLIKILSSFANIFYFHEEWIESLIFYRLIYQLLLIKYDHHLPITPSLEIDNEESIMMKISDVNLYCKELYSNGRYETLEMVHLLQNTGLVLLAMGKLNEAKEVVDRALAILVRRHSDEFQLMKSVVETLVIIVKYMEQNEEDVEELESYGQLLDQQLLSYAQAGTTHLKKLSQQIENNPLYDLNWNLLLKGLFKGNRRVQDADDLDEMNESGEEEVHHQTRRRVDGKDKAYEHAVDEEAGVLNKQHRWTTPPQQDQQSTLTSLQQLFFTSNHNNNQDMMPAAASIFTHTGEELELGSNIVGKKPLAPQVINKFQSAASRVRRRSHQLKVKSNAASVMASSSPHHSKHDKNGNRVKFADVLKEGDVEEKSDLVDENSSSSYCAIV